jgi:hypothetical protein
MLGGGDDPGQRAETAAWIEAWQGPPIGVSLVALGETFVELTKHPPAHTRSAPTPYGRWLSLVTAGKVEVCWADHYKPQGTLLDRAGKLHRALAGNDFGPCDALIVACAVLCPDCLRLHTTDRSIGSLPAGLLRKASGSPLRIEDRLF